MSNRYFKSEAEATHDALARSLERTSERNKIEEERLVAILYASVIKKLDPETRRFFKRDNELREVLKAAVGLLYCDVRSLAEGDLKVTLDAYDKLKLALEKSVSSVLVAGEPEKWNVFAVVDESDYHIGVYIPKAKRQILIENAIKNASKDLEEYFAGKGAILGHYTRMAVMDILWQQSYPYKIPKITVNACKSDIFGQNVQSKTLPNGRVMQYYYNTEQATLYYHIVC